MCFWAAGSWNIQDAKMRTSVWEVPKALWETPVDSGAAGQ